MKVLLLTVTAGHGHTQAAKAVMECLQNIMLNVLF